MYQEMNNLFTADPGLLMSVTKASYYYLHPYDMICDTRPARGTTESYDPACHRRDRRFVTALTIQPAVATQSWCGKVQGRYVSALCGTLR